MARKNHNALKGTTRGKRYRQYQPTQYAALVNPSDGVDLVRIIRPTSRNGFIVELPNGKTAALLASEVIL